MIKIFLFHSHVLMTSEMLIERQCLHHNKQCIQVAEKSSWLMYGWLVVHGPHDSPKYIFNKSEWLIITLKTLKDYQMFSCFTHCSYGCILSHFSRLANNASNVVLEKKKKPNVDC